MRTVTVQRVIDAPAEKVFDWLCDASNLRRVPGILSVRVQAGPAEARGVGTVRVVTTPLLKVMEEITAVYPPTMMQYHIRSSVPPLDHEGGSVCLRQVADGTEVTWSSTFQATSPIASRGLTAILSIVLTTAFRTALSTADRELTIGKRRR
jgi:uncharacterized protein YndB with AHSA1/START domain